MRAAVLLSLALATVLSACSTPVEPESRTLSEPTSQAGKNTSAADSAAARGGNLMGSGH